jgi:hypothetical protein
MSCSQRFKFYAECGHSQCLISHRDFCPSEGAPPILGTSGGELQCLSPTWRFQTAPHKTSMPQSQADSSCEHVGKTFQMLKQICDICALDCQAQTEVWRSDFKWSKLSKDEIEDRRKQWIELLTKEGRKSEEKEKQTLADEESQAHQSLWCKDFEACKSKERKERTSLVDRVQIYNPTQNSSEFLAIPSRERLRYLVVRPDSCSICHEGIYIRADIRELPCKHLFHSGCIRGQLSLGNTCPFCNHEYQIVRMPPSFDKPAFATYQCDDFGPRWLQAQVGGYVKFSQNMNNLELRCWGEEPDPLELGFIESEDTDPAKTDKEVPTLDREEPWDLIMPELPLPSIDELPARLARLRT